MRCLSVQTASKYTCNTSLWTRYMIPNTTTNPPMNFSPSGKRRKPTPSHTSLGALKHILLLINSVQMHCLKTDIPLLITPPLGTDSCKGNTNQVHFSCLVSTQNMVIPSHFRALLCGCLCCMQIRHAPSTAFSTALFFHVDLELSDDTSPTHFTLAKCCGENGTTSDT